MLLFSVLSNIFQCHFMLLFVFSLLNGIVEGKVTPLFILIKAFLVCFGLYKLLSCKYGASCKHMLQMCNAKGLFSTINTCKACYFHQNPPCNCAGLGPFASPVRCSFNRSVMPCGVLVLFRSWFTREVSFTDSKPTSPLVGCPMTGRTRVYIHSVSRRGGDARTPLTVMQAPIGTE